MTVFYNKCCDDKYILSNTMTKLPPCPFSVCNGCKKKITLSRNDKMKFIIVRPCVFSFFSKYSKCIPCKKGINDIKKQFDFWEKNYRQLNKFYNYT